MNGLVNNLPEALRKVQLPKSFGDFKNMNMRDQLILTGMAGVGTFVSLKVINKLFGTDPLGRTGELLGKFAVQESSRQIDVNQMIDQYNDLHDDNSKSLNERNSAYTTLVSAYYELATLFYEVIQYTM